MKRYWKRILLRFDRSFSTNKMLKPILWVVGFCVLWTLAFWLIGLVWGATAADEGTSAVASERMDEVLHLMLGQSNYPIESGMPHWYQLVIAFVGTMFFTAFLISAFSNLLSNRAASHRKGFLHYYFSDHILVMGGSKIVVGILKSIAADASLKKKDVVIVTNQDAEELWVQIVPLLTDEERMVSLTIYHGERNMEKSLRFSQAEKASLIYITGEDDEKEHDSINVDCWKLLKDLRSREATSRAQCYLTFERNASTYLFHALPEEQDTSKMETTIVNRLESIAQQILIGDDKRWKDFTLDRGAITMESEKYVHLVVAGMTQMGYAMASTAAHLCHYPNFEEGSAHPIRTKITFIDKNAEREMKFFRGRYPGLFKVSHWCLWKNGELTDKEGNMKEYGDFMDVEWEFMEGELVDDWIRERLEKWRKDEAQILTLALCDDEPEKNIANALYLPEGFYRPVASRGELEVNDPLIWVYQPVSNALIEAAEDVRRYANILSFGTMFDSYDMRLEGRITSAKRINYLYCKTNNYVMMPAENDELDELWRKLSFANKMSNLYAANSIYTKFRSMGVSTDGKKKITFDVDSLERLAKMEHARWNIEKLLVGFRPLPQEERARIKQGLEKGDETVKKRVNDLKKNHFEHKDIAPYGELLKSSQEYDKVIVRNLSDVISN